MRAAFVRANTRRRRRDRGLLALLGIEAADLTLHARRQHPRHMWRPTWNSAGARGFSNSLLMIQLVRRIAGRQRLQLDE
jgi:hypothetical protein